MPSPSPRKLFLRDRGHVTPSVLGGLAKAWGSEVKGHILQIPEGEWRQLKVPPSLRLAWAEAWGTGGTAEVDRGVAVTFSSPAPTSRKQPLVAWCPGVRWPFLDSHSVT